MNESSHDDDPDDRSVDDFAGVFELQHHNARGRLAEESFDASTDAPHFTIDP